ncbi:MAG: Diaminopimelate decarboxylase [Pseudomonadota bacterium]|jgi:diaminopimelate decarboxylase
MSSISAQAPSKRLSSAREALLRKVAAEVGTPLFVYDAESIRRQLSLLREHFAIVRFAQKACSNTHILRLLREQGARVDCVSEGELDRALAAGFRGGREPAEIVYTADVLTEANIARLIAERIPLNAGSEDMLAQLGRRSRRHPVWLRINPGFGHGHSKKVNTGGEASKHGIWHENLPTALKHIDDYELDLVGLHMHIGSGVDFEHLQRVCDAMVAQVVTLGRDIRAISTGGGLPIPYRTHEGELDVPAYARCWVDARRRIEQHLGHSIELEVEPGRFLVGASGVLLGEVRATKDAGNNHFVLIDAGFNELARPAMYGAHHDISILARDPADRAERNVRPTLVAGPLCESGDVFTQAAGGEALPRPLPQAAVGDLLVLHDTGAYGASMSSNYNSRPLAAEVLIDGDAVRLIRRRQTIDELLALERV